MPFSSNPLLAPVFQSPVGDGRDHRPPVVSVKRAEDAIESGVRLHHNQRVEGYILQPEVEGLGVAPVELQTAPLASGGSVARHSRLTEGDVFLPITLVSPVPSALPSMFDALVDIVRPGQRDEDGLPYQFEVVVFDPYGQETRSRRLIFESGLGDPVRVNHHIWRTSITGRFVDPFWYGTVRELRRVLGSVDKKFITAHRGEITDTSPTTYEWEGARNSSPSIKRVDGEVIARNLATNPSQNRTGGNASNNRLMYESWVEQISGHPAGFTTAYAQRLSPAGIDARRDSIYSDYITGGTPLPAEHDALGMWVWANVEADVSIGAAESVRIEPNRWTWIFRDDASISGVTFDFVDFDRDHADAIAMTTGVLALQRISPDMEVTDFFDGSTPALYDGTGAYEFPFFPLRIGGSVVQGEYELQVEGDAPAYWSGVITPPGEDLLIQNAKGERIFVQGRVDEPILIQTRPQEQDITLADGTPIWDRIDPGDDDFFPLHPGKNTVHVSMVGATQQSEILIRYREAFFHSLGGGR